MNVINSVTLIFLLWGSNNRVIFQGVTNKRGHQCGYFAIGLVTNHFPRCRCTLKGLETLNWKKSTWQIRWFESSWPSSLLGSKEIPHDLWLSNHSHISISSKMPLYPTRHPDLISSSKAVGSIEWCLWPYSTSSDAPCGCLCPKCSHNEWIKLITTINAERNVMTLTTINQAWLVSSDTTLENNREK